MRGKEPLFMAGIYQVEEDTELPRYTDAARRAGACFYSRPDAGYNSEYVLVCMARR